MTGSEKFERGISRQIEEAQRKGAFDNLPGKGKPLKLDLNPNANPETEAAFRLLKDNNFTLPWMAKGQQIERDLESARKSLALTWELVQRSGPAEGWVQEELSRAKAAFRLKIADLNKQIRDYNLEIPHPRLERFILDVDAEIAKICA